MKNNFPLCCSLISHHWQMTKDKTQRKIFRQVSAVSTSTQHVYRICGLSAVTCFIAPALHLTTVLNTDYRSRGTAALHPVHWSLQLHLQLILFTGGWKADCLHTHTHTRTDARTHRPALFTSIDPMQQWRHFLFTFIPHVTFFALNILLSFRFCYWIIHLFCCNLNFKTLHTSGGLVEQREHLP